jgi:iron(III) transport system ATP-binding protein
MDSMAETDPSRSEAPHIRIENLTKRFGAFTALKSVSLEVNRGELICFLGPSGCGKTTLLRALAGLDPQDSGRIEIAGRDVARLPPAARDFGIVFQSYALFPNLTVSDNIAYGLVNRHAKLAERQAKVAELLALVGLPDQGLKYPAQLSGGQQQRVALARALATSPALLLLDEPLSALDARVRVRLRSEIQALQRRLGVTTILVTHDQEEALAMADRIVVMNDGTIEQVGTPEEIYARPATAFVADFVGQMTFLDAHLTTPAAVSVGPHTLQINETKTLAVGTAVSIGFRPEEIQVRGITPSTPNTFDVTITTTDYLGAYCRLGLAVMPDATLHFVADVSSNEMRDMGLATGQLIKVALPPEHLRTFPSAVNPSSSAPNTATPKPTEHHA